MPKLDHNLVFGERHNRPAIRTFLNRHMKDFYERDYRVLVCEINGELKVGDLIVSDLPEGSTLQAAVDHILELVIRVDELLENVREQIPLLSAQGVEREAFGLLLRRALENKIRLRFIDYAEGEWQPGEVRTKGYNDYVSPFLKGAKEKWLELTGDDHVASSEGVTGIVEQVGQNVVGFRFQDVVDALADFTLTTIEDLERVPSITNADVQVEEEELGSEQAEEPPVDQLASLRAILDRPVARVSEEESLTKDEGDVDEESLTKGEGDTDEEHRAEGKGDADE